METNQTKFWSGEFGQAYTERNPQNAAELNDLYKKSFTLSRDEMNRKFLGGIPKDAKILEVGCNVGAQLLVLQEMGFQHLYGIELQWYAVEKAKASTKNINIIQGSGFDLPFKDNYFDLVYTSGVLIHIQPQDHPKIMGEITRCSSQWIWGFEYYAESIHEIPYRGHQGFMWKADYAEIYRQNCPALDLVKKEIYPYQAEQEKGNADCMFLLEK